MPRAKTKPDGLCDTWGRRNRKLEDRKCPACGNMFRPRGTTSKYCSEKCKWSKNGRKRKKERWFITKKGYEEGYVWIDESTQIRVKRHRFIMEGIIRRPLNHLEEIHHKDGNKLNNSPENLEIMDHATHMKTHIGRKYKSGYKLNLSEEERKLKSMRAITQGFAEIGRKAKAEHRALAVSAKPTGEATAV